MHVPMCLCAYAQPPQSAPPSSSPTHCASTVPNPGRWAHKKKKKKQKKKQKTKKKKKGEE